MSAVEYSSEYSTPSVCSQTTKLLMEMAARDGTEETAQATDAALESEFGKSQLPRKLPRRFSRAFGTQTTDSRGRFEDGRAHCCSAPVCRAGLYLALSRRIS